MPDRNWWTAQRVEGATYALSWLLDLTKKRHQEIAEKLNECESKRYKDKELQMAALSGQMFELKGMNDAAIEALSNLP